LLLVGVGGIVAAVNKAQLIALGIGCTAFCIAAALFTPIAFVNDGGTRTIDWGFTAATWAFCVMNVFNSDSYKDPTLSMMVLLPIIPVLIILATGVAIFLLRKPKHQGDA
jgi:hypothetical protein